MARIFKWLEGTEEKAMAPHSSTLAWRIPWTGQPGRLQAMGSRRVGHNWSDLAAAAEGTERREINLNCEMEGVNLT